MWRLLQIKPGESLKDFADLSECGGKLKVLKSIEEFENTSNKISRQNKTKTGFDKDYFNGVGYGVNIKNLYH